MNVVRFSALIVSVVFILGASAGVAPLRNFSAQSAVLERGYETTFLDVPSASGALDHARFLDGLAHYPGSYGDRKVAEYMRDKLREYGFDATLEPFRARIDSTKHVSLELLSSPRVGFTLTETPDPRDPDTSRKDAGAPFNYGSGDGDVRAALVYANRGTEADYAALQRAHVDVRTRLVLVRYGAEFRGNLARRAQAHGAAGVIFYSDPKDDGFVRGPVYPDGPYRPSGSVQRGTVSADPLHIPTLPVSADTAAVLLGNMTGAPGTADWDGALQAPYVYGMTRSAVHLNVQMYRNTTTIWNTIGKIQGTDPQQSVILGGHRDAWVYGVTDNGAGISTLLETARGLGYLHKTGWRPKRTIVVAGWDGEEIGELGSTNYVRTHMAQLKAGCIAYVNADENVSGPHFGAQAAAAIATEVVNATQTVTDPHVAQSSLFDQWLRSSRAASRNPRLVNPVVETPGGGSDHEPFQFEAGIPTASAGFYGPLGVYHSQYDDLQFATTIVDPEFLMHRTAAQLLGIIALRLADADTVPYRFSPYVSGLRAGAAAVAARLAESHQMGDERGLRGAIERFGAAARAHDARMPGARGQAAELQAVQLLDTTASGVNGYAYVPFPKLTAAIASGNPGAVTSAFMETENALNTAAALLR